jgi:mannan endo-1,4-beta-mannosidase
MRKQALVLIGALLAVATSTAWAGNSGFVQRQGDQLTLNGATYKFVGASHYPLMISYSSNPQWLDAILQTASANGLKVIRFWAFNDGLDGGWQFGEPVNHQAPALQYEPGRYWEPTFRALDYVIKRANDYNIRLIPALMDFGLTMGGAPQYSRWCGGNGHLLYFYDIQKHPACGDLYKNMVKRILNRVNTYTGVAYKDDPTIVAWQLVDEPTLYDQADFSGEIMRHWVSTMAAYTKSIDRKHLVYWGEIGTDTTYKGYSPVNPYYIGIYGAMDWLFNGWKALSFTNNSADPNVDIASIHVYPTYTGMHWDQANTYITDHVRIAKNLGKPLVMDEFGWTGSPSRNEVYASWLDALITAGGAGALVWQLSPNWCDEFCLAPGDDGWTAITQAAQGMSGLSVALPAAPPAAATVTIGPSTASPSSTLTGKTVAVSTKVTASAALSGAIVDIEVYDASGVKVAQKVYGGQSFAAGVSRSFSWTWAGSATAGTYTVRVGVFNADWSTMYKWDNAASSITISAPPAFTVTSTTVSPQSTTRGQASKIVTSVKSRTAAAGIQVDLELVNSAGTRVAQSTCTKTFAAGQTLSCGWSYVVPQSLPVGTYTVKVGVFSADWSTLHLWVNQAGTLVVK